MKLGDVPMIRKIGAFGAGLAAVALVAWSVWWWLGLPVEVVDAPPGKVHCVSYTPFRSGETPFDEAFVADPRRIEEDMRLVSEFSDCIRLYAPDQGLSAAVPYAAARHMKVLLGMWISGDNKSNEKQIALALAVAKAHPDAIKAMIVGNEVLLRGEQTAATMAALARRVKAETGLPVTYADVTDFWLTAPRDLANAVDFITIHVLPYWEDEPASAAQGMDVVRSAVERVRAKFPDKPIFIGETGFPSKGRERKAAVPSLVSQALYLRSFLVYADQAGLDYSLIEAFDQPWKRLLEGTAGGYWGMLDAARAPKFPWRGSVSNHPKWKSEAAASFAGAALLLFAWLAAGGETTMRRAVVLGIMAGLGGILLVLQVEHSWAAWRSIDEFFVEFLVLIQSAAALVLLPPEMMKGRAGAVPAPLSVCLEWVRRLGAVRIDRELAFGMLRLVTSVFALVTALCLAFDPRYRDFPNAAFAVSAIGFSWLALCRNDSLVPVRRRLEEAMLALLFAAATAIILVDETPLNIDADIWCGLSLLMALPWIGAVRGLFMGVPVRTA